VERGLVNAILKLLFLNRTLVALLWVVSTCVGLGLCLFAGGLAISSGGVVGAALRIILDILHEKWSQLLILVCLVVYFIGLWLLLPRRPTDIFWSHRKPQMWMLAAILFGVFKYIMDYPLSSSSSAVIVMVSGAASGLAAVVWVAMPLAILDVQWKRRMLIALITGMLTMASLWRLEMGMIYYYQGHVRWAGMWNNPNVAALLMGVGSVLAMGQVVSPIKCNMGGQAARSWSWKVGIRKCAIAFLLLVGAGFMGRRLLYSYSRGAWLGVVLGIGYLAWRAWGFHRASRSRITNAKSQIGNWDSANANCLCVIVLSLGMLCFWQFRQTGWRPARRAFSAASSVDFSWRNRVVAWEGDLQITAEYPWFGAGWNQPQPLYEYYYLPANVDEGGAIEMNDYLMLGATIGVPALFCFCMYLCLSFKESVRQESRPTGNQGRFESDWLKAVCRAGALVLLVGFWFDGGLFKLPTAATFWILLELGAAEPSQPHAQTDSPDTKSHEDVS
jgi:hypothetical protein